MLTFYAFESSACYFSLNKQNEGEKTNKNNNNKCTNTVQRAILIMSSNNKNKIKLLIHLSMPPTPIAVSSIQNKNHTNNEHMRAVRQTIALMSCECLHIFYC